MAGLVRRVAVWQVCPWGAGPQDPQDAIEHGTVLPPRAPSTVFAAWQLRQEGANEDPLIVREVTGMRRARKGHPARMALSPSGYWRRRAFSRHLQTRAAAGRPLDATAPKSPRVGSRLTCSAHGRRTSPRSRRRGECDPRLARTRQPGAHVSIVENPVRMKESAMK